MRCSKCGKEFGEGVNCQNCGVDRVTGLANYSNYGTSDYQGTNASYNESSYSPSPKTTVCYACSEIIPVGSTFCPVCGKKLSVVCPNCGNEYSSQYPVCNKCGTNREEYNKAEKKREAERERNIRRKKEEEAKKEKEQKIINDALQLKKELHSKIGCVIIGLSTVLGVIVSVTLFHNILGSGGNIIGDIFLDILRGGLFGLLIGGGIVSYTIDWDKRNREIVNKWKKEHPNDPRSKYL